MINDDHPVPVNQGRAHETMYESIVGTNAEWNHKFPLQNHDLQPYWDNYEFRDASRT